MLLLPVLEKEENKNGDVDKLLQLWRKREKQSMEREKCDGEDGCPASSDIVGVG